MFNPCLRSLAMFLLLPIGFLVAQQPPPLVPTAQELVKAKQLLNQKKRPAIRGDIHKGPDDVLIAPPRDTPLPNTAIEALVLQNQWMAGENKPKLGKRGEILYTFGDGLPIIVTAENNVTEIDLQPGEQLVKDGIDIGDDRFQPVPHEKIGPDGPQTYIVLKPRRSGMDTTMIVGTDKRSYYLRLISKPYEHLGIVAFTYPDEEAARKRREYETQKAAEKAKEQATEEEGKKEAQLRAADTTGPCRNTDYSIKVGKHAGYFRPPLVCDDGLHVYIQLPETIKGRDFPKLEVIGVDGIDSPNVRADNEHRRFMTDGLFRSANLVAGTGKHRLTVTITNNQRIVADNHGTH